MRCFLPLALEAVNDAIRRRIVGVIVVVCILSVMVLDGSLDVTEAPVAASEMDDPDGDGVVNEIPESIIDFTEFYLLNFFRPGCLHGNLIQFPRQLWPI